MPDSRLVRRQAFNSATPPLAAASEKRPAERRFGDEHVAGDRLERATGRVGLRFVVAADDPRLAAMLDAHLGGAEDVARRMQRDAHFPQLDRIAVGERLHASARAQPRTEHSAAVRGGQIPAASAPGMIGVRNA